MVTPGTGGVADFVARLIAPGLASSLGQPVIVDNRPSAIVPGEIVSRALPDGYTLLAIGPPLWIGPLLEKTPYDPVKDFAPITLVGTAPGVLVIQPSLPIKSVRELIEYARSKPGVLNYASIATGSATHLAAELFKAMAGVDFVRVNYKGAAASVNDLLGGQVQLMFASAVSVVPHVKSGKLRALGVTSAESSALVPGLPAIGASGLPGYESIAMYGVLAPAATPLTVINRLNREIVTMIKLPDATEKFLNVGVEIVGSAPEYLSLKMKSDMARMGKVIKDAGIRAE